MKAEWVPPSSHLSREPRLAVSACLAGCPCRYDGRSRPSASVQALVASGDAVALCPEYLGDLPIPRSPGEIVGGSGFDVLDGTARVLSADGSDLTGAFLAGARRTLEQIRRQHISAAILKGKSPSCGVFRVYDGTFTGTLRDGPGVTAALLLRNGIHVAEE